MNYFSINKPDRAITPDVGTFCIATDGNHGKTAAWAARISGKNCNFCS